MRVLKDRARRHGGLVAAVGALQKYLSDRPDLVTITTRTAKAIWPPQFAKILTARLLRSEAGVELAEVSRIVLQDRILPVVST